MEMAMAYHLRKGGVAMICTNTSIQDVYMTLSKIMRYPQQFGLGQNVPEPLAKALEGVLSKLCQFQMEPALNEMAGLAHELSQDTNQPARVNSWDSPSGVSNPAQAPTTIGNGSGHARWS
jgi:hypothetical protein